MIKLLDILEEGTLSLTPDERQQVEAMIPDIIDNIKKPLLSNDKVYNIGTIKYKFADGEDGEALVAVGYPGSDKARGVFYTKDPKNRTDNWIVISHTYFQQYFPPNDFDQKLYQKFSGTANTGIERLRQVLKHELIHAKDPALNHHYLKEPYSSDDPSVYYKSWAEFQTFTGQFFESLISGTDRVLDNASNANDIKRIESALANILQFFAGKTKSMSIKTAEFIDGTGSRNIFQKLFNFIDSIVGNLSQSSDFALHEYVAYLNLIKQYNPEGYKEFLKDLYKTIKSIEEKVNSVSATKIKVQEMKLNINEVKRFQQLAGILNESIFYSLNESEQAADKAVDDLKQKAEKAGVDTDNEKVQMDILNKMIDADFDLAKINVNQIKEYDENLEESGGALATSVHVGVEILENVELIEKIAHLLHVDTQKVKNALKWVVKITSYPSRLIDKLFFKVARLLGANVENARIAGMGGLALVALVCFVFGIIYFPSLLPSVVGFWGLAKFIWAIIKSISGIHTMWKQLTGAQQEQKAYTTSDFFKEIEKKYMETEGSEGKKIPTDWVYELSDWYNSLSKSDKTQASTTMKSLAQSINSGKAVRGHVQKLNDMGNTDSKVIFNTIATYIELMQKGVTVSDKFKQSSDKLEEIAKEILLKCNK